MLSSLEPLIPHSFSRELFLNGPFIEWFLKIWNYFTLKRKGTAEGWSAQSTTRCIQRSRRFVQRRLSPRWRDSRGRLGIGTIHCHGNQRRVAAMVILLGWFGPVSIIRETICEWLEDKKKEYVRWKKKQRIIFFLLQTAKVTSEVNSYIPSASSSLLHLVYLCLSFCNRWKDCYKKDRKRD